MIIILNVLECIRIGILKWYIIIHINSNPKRTKSAKLSGKAMPVVIICTTFVLFGVFTLESPTDLRVTKTLMTCFLVETPSTPRASP